MHVSQIWRYPVKSMLGETLDTAGLTVAGLDGDRAWSARDAGDGSPLGGKKIGALMRCAARTSATPGGPIEITLPDGSITTTAAPDVHDCVSAAVGHALRLEPLRPASDLDFYRRRPSTSQDPMADTRAVLGLEEGDPFPDFSIFPPGLFEFDSPPGTYLDAFALMLVSTSALRSLAEALPDSRVDVRRFRPNLLVDTGDEPGYPELGWPPGTRFRVGGAVVEIAAPCLRCVMTTKAINDDIPADRAPLRYLVRQLHQNFGAYATVVEPGEVEVGAPLLAV